jgi:hypothetical protein
MTIANTYDIGDYVRLSSTYTIDNVPTNPTAVFVFVQHPNGVLDSYTTGDLTNSSTGTFHIDITVDASGRWDYRFTSSGTVIAADENFFIVERSAF